MSTSRNFLKSQRSALTLIRYRAQSPRGIALSYGAQSSRGTALPLEIQYFSQSLGTTRSQRTLSTLRKIHATTIAHKAERLLITKLSNLVGFSLLLVYTLVIVVSSLRFGYAVLFIGIDVFSQLKFDVPSPRDLTIAREADLQQVTQTDTHVPTQSAALKACNGFYRPLIYREEIRLLVLEPGAFEDDFSFSLEHIKLGHDNVAYEALSYAWGTSKDAQSLPAVAGPCPPVNSNLLSSLRHLRYSDRTRRLWIDALCIDQSDLEERGQQVRLMGNIFSTANRVVVWLGEEYDRSDQAFSSLMQLYDRSWKSRFWYVTWSKKEGGRSIRRQFVARTLGQLVASIIAGLDVWTLDNFDIEEMDWSAIRSLLQRSWFHRLWVIQEVSHARKAIVLCGHTEVAWSSFSAALIYLVENDLAMYLDPICAAACDSIAGIERMRSRTLQDPLFDVTLDNSYGGCTDSRDKLFAMMSMAKGRDAYDWEVSLDYTLTAEELYKRFAI